MRVLRRDDGGEDGDQDEEVSSPRRAGAAGRGWRGVHYVRGAMSRRCWVEEGEKERRETGGGRVELQGPEA